MLILFILGLVLGVVAIVFSLQNVAIVTVSFFSWQLQSSLAVVLLLALISGIFICLLILLPGTIQINLRLRAMKKQNEKLEEELRKQKELTVFAKDVPPTEEIIDKIESGAIAEHGTDN